MTEASANIDREKTPEQLCQERAKRLVDAIHLRQPDRVPISLGFGNLLAEIGGITRQELCESADLALTALEKAAVRYQARYSCRPVSVCSIARVGKRFEHGMHDDHTCQLLWNQGVSVHHRSGDGSGDNQCGHCSRSRRALLRYDPELWRRVLLNCGHLFCQFPGGSRCYPAATSCAG